MASTGIGKVFDAKENIGSSKYVVNYHDGEKTHKDGSPFFDIAIFKNKRLRDAFLAGLRRRGTWSANG